MAILVAIFLPQSAFSGQREPKNGGQTVLYFGNASSRLLRGYHTNNLSFALLDTLLTPPRGIDSILITGDASPVGSKWYNRQLSLNRARAVRRYLQWRYPDLCQSRLVPVDGQLWARSTESGACEAIAASEPAAPAATAAAPSSSVVPDGPRFALKTNLLYWAALTPNIEAEWCFARRWSIGVEFQSAWWANRKTHKYFRLMAGGPEVRYWIAHREHFKGHFVGAYLGAGLYEFMGRPSYGLQGEFYITGGLSYGYSFRVGKRLRMEASIGVGYLQTEYREYHWDAGCYVYDRTKQQTYFGPTKAKLTLTYPLWWLGSKQKGGAR